MGELLEHYLDDMHRYLRTLAIECARAGSAGVSSAPRWTPAINVYRCTDRFVVCMDLAGVRKSDLSVRSEPHLLRISGHRLPPEPQVELVQVLAMEIDYGRFERILRLPTAVDPERASAEQRDGWLWIQLPMVTLV
jgi:HSP20 family molecular chaperone IbpA